MRVPISKIIDLSSKVEQLGGRVTISEPFENSELAECTFSNIDPTPILLEMGLMRPVFSKWGVSVYIMPDGSVDYSSASLGETHESSTMWLDEMVLEMDRVSRRLKRVEEALKSA